MARSRDRSREARLATSARVAVAPLVLAAGVVAACGGGPQLPLAEAPAVPTPSASDRTVRPAPSAASMPVGAPSVSATPAPPLAPPMKPIAPTAMSEELTSLGIDPLTPVPLNKLSPDKLRRIMPTFARSLGVKCVACHEPDDFKAPTPNKRIAARMWNDLVVHMTMADGTPLYCDSCHGGRAKFLDRRDPKALSAWMDESYVKKLRRSDDREHSCEQCHGDPFEPKILAAWAKAK